MKTKDGLQLSYALLSTEDASPDILILKDDGELKVWGKQDFDMWKMHQQFGDFKPQGAKWQHLYITSDTPMKDGDWGIDIGGTEDAEAVVFKFWAKGTEDDDKNDEDFKKIEFTTDPKLIADGVAAIDGETIAQVNSKRDDAYFLTEFCKRWNEKSEYRMPKLHKFQFVGNGQWECINCLYTKTNNQDEYGCGENGNQKVDVENAIRLAYQIIIDNNCQLEKRSLNIIEQALQSNAGGFSLEDCMNALHKAELKHDKDYTKIWEIMKTHLQSLTKEQPKGDTRIPGGANLRVIKPKDIVIELNDGKLYFK